MQICSDIQKGDVCISDVRNKEYQKSYFIIKICYFSLDLILNSFISSAWTQKIH